DDGAVTAMWPIFKRKLSRYEGAELENAWAEVASSFDPTRNKPYPVPKDFEAVLPVPGKLRATAPALDFKGRTARRAELVAGWLAEQGLEIRTTHGPRVAFYCEMEVRQRAGNLAWGEGTRSIRLSVEDVKLMEDRIVSSDRLDVFGASVLRS